MAVNIDSVRADAKKWWAILNNPQSATYKIAHAYALGGPSECSAAPKKAATEKLKK